VYSVLVKGLGWRTRVSCVDRPNPAMIGGDKYKFKFKFAKLEITLIPPKCRKPGCSQTTGKHSDAVRSSDIQHT
jgi:hypothetical protein